MKLPAFLAFLMVFVAIADAAPVTIAEIKREAPVNFAKDIQPLLKRNCLACHNASKAKAGLNLETPGAILKGGESGPAATAGHSAESLLLKAAAHLADPPMPPPGNKVNAADLSSEELGLLKLWIDQGMKSEAGVEAALTWRRFPGQTAPVSAAAVSPGGRYAAAARGNQVQIMDIATGASHGFLDDPDLAKLELYQGRPVADRDTVMAVAFGQDDLLATAGYRTVRLWRRAPLAIQRETAVLPNPVTCLAAGETLAAAGEATGSIRLWDASADKTEVHECKDHAAAVTAVAFSPDRRFLVSVAADRSARIWDAASRTVVYRAESPSVIHALCFLKNGTELAAAGAEGMLRVYPFSDQTPAGPPMPLREWKLSDRPAIALLGLDAAGTQIIWSAGDAKLHVTDAADGKHVREFAIENPAASAAGALDRRVHAAQRHMDGRKARLITAVEAAKKESESVKTAHRAMEKARADWQQKLELARRAADALRVLPDDNGRKEADKKANAAEAAAGRVFNDARSNAALSVRLAGKALQAQVNAEAAAAAAETALAEATGAKDAAAKQSLTPLPALKSLAFSSDRRAVIAAFDGGLIQWHSPESGGFLDAAEGAFSGGGPVLLAASSSGLLAARPDKKVVVLPDRRLWQRERMLGAADKPDIFAGRITALAFSTGARLLATGGGIPSRSGEAKIWNVSDGALVTTLTEPHSDTVNALAFSPDDSLIATAGSDRWARVFNVSDGKRTASFEGHTGHVLSIAWRSDGLALATGASDKSVRFWDLLDAKQTRTITTFGKEVSAVAWLGTGDTVASACGDAAVRLNEEALPGAKGFCHTLATDAAGTLLAAGSDDGILRLWNAAEKKLLREWGP